MPFLLSLLAAVASLAARSCTAAAVPAPAPEADAAFVAPYYVPAAPAHDLVNDSYVVVFREDAPPTALAAHMSFLEYASAAHPLRADDRDGDDDDEGAPRAAVEYVYSEVVKGYAGAFSADVLQMVRARPEVKYVERDRRMYASRNVIQRDAPWGLARISHHGHLRPNMMHYVHDSRAGEGVTVYVLDTGVFYGHPEFEGRARWGVTVNKRWHDRDDQGHGTHCAGTVAARTFGVAKRARVVAVKVLGGRDGAGTSADFLAGLEWAARDAGRARVQAEEELRATGRTAYRGAVASASLGGPKSRAEVDAVNAAVRGGLHMAVAAGNDAADACGESPAAAALPITVGASTVDDACAEYSNRGKCVDVFAPGSDVLSTWNSWDKLTKTISGTSMATPHVAGLMAYLLSIYPSTEFNPAVVDDERSVFASAYAAAYGVLPGFMASVLPSPNRPLASQTMQSATPLTPKKLKRAVLKMAGRNRLDYVPKHTPNLLIYNNASHPSRNNALGLEDDFWDNL